MLKYGILPGKETASKREKGWDDFGSQQDDNICYSSMLESDNVHLIFGNKWHFGNRHGLLCATSTITFHINMSEKNKKLWYCGNILHDRSNSIIFTYPISIY